MCFLGYDVILIFLPITKVELYKEASENSTGIREMSSWETIMPNSLIISLGRNTRRF